MISNFTKAQSDKAQIPAVLNNSYFEVNVGYINYPFGAGSLEIGYTLKSVVVPHIAVRVVMFGHQFNKYLSAQLSYLRPVLWVKYTFDKSTPGSEETRTVWMNIAGATILPQLPLSDHFTVFGEAGLAIITRHGFNDNYGNAVVKNATYPYWMLGGGVKYNINQNWHLMLSIIYSPEKTTSKQPSTTYCSAGFTYMMHKLTAEKLEAKNKTGYIFPRRMLQIGYSSNISGYGVNYFFTTGKIPVFWLGDSYVQNGFTINYLQNIYHGTKVFSFDWGTSLGFWRSKTNGETFFTLSVFPLFRWTVLHTKPADLYLLYSLAGPTYISTSTLDGYDLGKKFTFQDYMGTGFFVGKERKMSIEFRISHYSNGNIFPRNAGVAIPLSLNLGYSF